MKEREPTRAEQAIRAHVASLPKLPPPVREDFSKERKDRAKKHLESQGVKVPDNW